MFAQNTVTCFSLLVTVGPMQYSGSVLRHAEGISVQWYWSPPRWGHLGTVVLFSATLRAFRDSGTVLRHVGGIKGQWYCSPPRWGI